MGYWRKGHSLSCPPKCLLFLSLHFTIPPWILLLSPDFCVSPLCLFWGVDGCPSVSKEVECHVLAGVRGMLTGQTEGTDGSVTCPRSSGVPLLRPLNLKPKSFSFFRYSRLSSLFLTSWHFSLSLVFWGFLFHLLFRSTVYLPQCRSQSLLYKKLPISVQTHYPLKLFPQPYSHTDTRFHCWTFLFPIDFSVSVHTCWCGVAFY